MTAETTERHGSSEPAEAPAPQADGGSPFARDTEIGRYVILETVGRGGMGVVYAAYDSVLDRRVALKMLHTAPGGADGSERHRRLLREAQAITRLQHPNVLAVHDIGEID